MLTLRERRFMERTGRKNLGNQNTRVGYDKSKLRCYNYKQLGHSMRECLSLIITEPIIVATKITSIADKSESLMKETTLLTKFYWSAEITKTEEEIDHALMAQMIEI